ncbi:MAG: phage regulatory protein/antirepressor Ant [Saprospiraceae bacterium]
MNLVNISQSENFKHQATTTSLEVAQAFEKRHDHVLRDINDILIKSPANAPNFGLCLTTKELETGSTRGKHYEMNEDGFTILVMGYNGAKALEFKTRYIKLFRGVRELLMSDDYIFNRAFEIYKSRNEILTGQVKQLEQTNLDLSIKNVLQESTIESQEPIVKYAEEVLSAKNSWTTTTIAAEIGVTANKLNAMLREIRVQRMIDNHWVLMAKYQGQDYTKTKTHTFQGADGETRTTMLTTWTEKGRQFIHSLFPNVNQNGIRKVATA